MAKAKKAKRKSRAIVRGHLERIKSKVVEDYKDHITKLIGQNHGVYALYKDDELYYVGLATDLKGRIRNHLKNRHKGKWNRFSLYIIRKQDHIREVESLLMRIARPPGNRQLGKLSRSKNLMPDLIRMLDEHIKRLLGKPKKTGRKKIKKKVKKKSKKVKVQKIQRPLKGLIGGGKRIYATYKGKDYKAVVYNNGKIKLDGIFYESPSGAGKAIVNRSVDGWYFWKYKDNEGNLVRIHNLRKKG
jgi:hypothetical protein